MTLSAGQPRTWCASRLTCRISIEGAKVMDGTHAVLAIRYKARSCECEMAGKASALGRGIIEQDATFFR